MSHNGILCLFSCSCMLYLLIFLVEIALQFLMLSFAASLATLLLFLDQWLPLDKLGFFSLLKE